MENSIICHNCQDKQLAGLEVQALSEYMSGQTHGLSALDIGCGDSGDGEVIFANQQYRGVDKAEGINAEVLPFRENMFFYVLMKRILCQHESLKRKQIIAEARRVCKNGGQIIVCEPWQHEYTNLNYARRRSGIKSLPEPKFGGNFLGDAEFRGLELIVDIPIGPDYVFWTRFLYEAITKRMIPYDHDALRESYPAMYPGASKLCPYRAKVYKNG